MASYTGAALGQAVGNIGGGFADALSRLAQSRRDERRYQERMRMERQRYDDRIESDRTKWMIEAARTPGLYFGEPSAPAEMPTFDAIPDAGYATPPPRTEMVGTPRSSLTAMGDIGGTPLLVNPSELRGEDEGPETPWESQGMGRDEYLDWRRQLAAATRAPSSAGGRNMTQGQAYAFLKDMYSDDEGRMALPPERAVGGIHALTSGDTGAARDTLAAFDEEFVGGGAGGPTWNPLLQQWEVEDPMTGQMVEANPEEFANLYAREEKGVGIPGLGWLNPDEQVPVPPSDTARVREMQERGAEPRYRDDRLFAHGEPDLGRSAPADTTDPVQSRAQRYARQAGGVDAAIQRLEGLGDLNAAERQVLEALRDMR